MKWTYAVARARSSYRSDSSPNDPVLSPIDSACTPSRSSIATESDRSAPRPTANVNIFAVMLRVGNVNPLPTRSIASG
jgi:hypothetical protein